MLKRLRAQQITILVSTPYMDEASLCERVALIQKGKIMQVDSPQGIIDQYDKYLWAADADNDFALLSSLRAQPEVHSAYPSGAYTHFTTLEKIDPDQIKKRIDLPGVIIKPQKPTIEDCFMSLMEEGE
jgi:ABC-type multidrug transport system ATPase subunit